MPLAYTPKHKKDFNTTLFADFGAWHAYAVPNDKNYFGGFSGPVVIDRKPLFISENFSQLILEIDGEKVDFSAAKTPFQLFCR